MTDRMGWDEAWMLMAKVIGQRSLCDRRRVGAVIATFDQQVAAVSYNGPAAGLRHETPCLNWCPRAQRLEADHLPEAHAHLADYTTCPSIHAEANALLRADRSRIEGGTIYVTSAVCMDCAKLISNSGLLWVEMLVHPGDAHRRPDDVAAYLRSAGVQVEIHQAGGEHHGD